MTADTHPSLQVLLGTFNGEKFLHEQLRSLADQTFSDFEVLVSDDASTDGTLDVIESFRPLLRIRQLPLRSNLAQARSARRNFEYLISSSSASLIALCDQDDIWDADKLQRMLDVERKASSREKVLFYSDARTVDRDGRTLSPSYFRSARKDPRRNDLRQVLVENVVSGNMSLIRGEFARSAMPLPEASPGHDWWLAARAAAVDGLCYIPCQLVSYRQHGSNEVGVPALSLRTLTAEARSIAKRSNRQLRIQHKINQAESLARLLDDHKGPAAALGAIPNQKKISRVRTLASYGLWHSNLIRNLAFVALV